MRLARRTDMTSPAAASAMLAALPHCARSRRGCGSRTSIPLTITSPACSPPSPRTPPHAAPGSRSRCSPPNGSRAWPRTSPASRAAPSRRRWRPTSPGATPSRRRGRRPSRSSSLSSAGSRNSRAPRRRVSSTRHGAARRALGRSALHHADVDLHLGPPPDPHPRRFPGAQDPRHQPADRNGAPRRRRRSCRHTGAGGRGRAAVRRARCWADRCLGLRLAPLPRGAALRHRQALLRRVHPRSMSTRAFGISSRHRPGQRSRPGCARPRLRTH